jgi:nitrate reductase gamma subunit
VIYYNDIDGKLLVYYLLHLIGRRITTMIDSDDDTNNSNNDYIILILIIVITITVTIMIMKLAIIQTTPVLKSTASPSQAVTW